MIRWVIVAQFSGSAHEPTVYGTWETQEAALAQLERWERRIVRSLGSRVGWSMTVEPIYGKKTSTFGQVFARQTGVEL